MSHFLFSHSFHANLGGLDVDIECDFHDDLSLCRVLAVVQIGGDVLPAKDIFVKIDGRLTSLYDAACMAADEQTVSALEASRRAWQDYDRAMARAAEA